MDARRAQKTEMWKQEQINYKLQIYFNFGHDSDDWKMRNLIKVMGEK